MTHVYLVLSADITWTSLLHRLVNCQAQDSSSSDCTLKARRYCLRTPRPLTLSLPCRLPPSTQAVRSSFGVRLPTCAPESLRTHTLSDHRGSTNWPAQAYLPTGRSDVNATIEKTAHFTVDIELFQLQRRKAEMRQVCACLWSSL